MMLNIAEKLEQMLNEKIVEQINHNPVKWRLPYY
jgi:hypothetical protein